MLKNYICHTTLILGLITFVLVSCNNNSDEFKVSGKIDNVINPFFYATYEKNDSLIIDTVSINDRGEFTFSGLVDTLTVVSLYFNQESTTPVVYVFVDKKWDVDLNGDVAYPDLILAKGGSVNDDLTEFKEKSRDLLKSRQEILNTILDDKKHGRNSNNLEKDSSADLKNVNFELSNLAAQYIKEHPDKIISVFLINAFFKDENTIPRLDENIALLRSDAASYPLVEDLKEFSRKVKKIEIGSIAPNFELKNLIGKDVNLTDYRGKYLVLSFLSTTCDACNIERKDAVALYNDLIRKKENIDILSVIIDFDIDPFPQTTLDSIKWTLLPEYEGWASPVFGLYNIREVPYNILISPTGVILDKDFIITELPEILKKHKDIASVNNKTK